MNCMYQRIIGWLKVAGWAILCAAVIWLVGTIISAMLFGCTLRVHLMEKHTHLYGEQRQAVEVVNDEGITLEIDE